MRQKEEMKELAALDNAALAKRLAEVSNELFTLRLNASTAHIKDYSQFKSLRKRVARIRTVLRSKSTEVE